MDYGLIVVVLVVALAACGAGVLILQRRWLKQLRSKHLAVWERLGSPVVIGSSVAVQWRVFRFIKSGEYRELGDADLELLTKSVIRWGLGYVAIFAATVAALATVFAT